MMLEDRPIEERMALAYCAPRGIALSTFFDKWSDNDRLAALDWLADQNSRCPGCGQKTDECMADIKVSPEYEATVLRCHACEVRRMTFAESDAKNPETLYGTVRKVSDA